MKPEKKKRESQEDLKFDNEFRKAKLQMEKGAAFHSGDNVPPEVEHLFLNQVEDFEKTFKNSKQVSVFEKLGKPKFRKVRDIPPTEIKGELNALCGKLAELGISVDSVCKVEDREMYRFITEDLFKHKTDNISLPGWVTGFIYEEFHPNHEHDVKEHATDFCKDILSDKGKIENFLLCKKMKISNGKVVLSEIALKKINSLRSFYSKFECEKFEILNLKINQKKTSAQVAFDVKYSAMIDGTSEKQIYSGAGTVVLKNEYHCNWWTIYQFRMPGFII